MYVPQPVWILTCALAMPILNLGCESKAPVKHDFSATPSTTPPAAQPTEVPTKSQASSASAQDLPASPTASSDRDGKDSPFRLTREFKGHKGPISCVEYDADSGTLVTGDFNAGIIVWDFKTGEKRTQLDKHKLQVSDLAIAPDHKSFASTGLDNSVRLWSLPGGDEIKSLPIVEEGKAEGQEDWGRVVAFSPDGSSLAAGTDGDVIIVWNAKTFERQKVLKGHEGDLRCLAFAPNGVLASGGWDNTVRLWNLSTGEQLEDYKHDLAIVLAVSFYPDGSNFVAANMSGNVFLQSMKSVDDKKLVKLAGGACHAVAVAANGQHVLCGMDSGQVHVVDGKSWTLLETFDCPKGVHGLKFLDDRSVVVVGGSNFDSFVQVWQRR